MRVGSDDRWTTAAGVTAAGGRPEPQPRHHRWAVLHHSKLRAPNGDVYLERVRLVQTPWFGVMLHRFLQPDADDSLHDHPWAFASLVLRGGYVEQHRADAVAPVRTRTRRPGSLHVMRKATFHRIAQLARVSTWTFVVVGPRRQTWGFLDQDGSRVRHDVHRAAIAHRTHRAADVK